MRAAHFDILPCEHDCIEKARVCGFFKEFANSEVPSMKIEEIKSGLTAVIRDEERYAKKLQRDGEYGRAKLAFAALENLRRALKRASDDPGSDFTQKLLDEIEEQRRDYIEFWDDEDGVGTSTFTRASNTVESFSD